MPTTLEEFAANNGLVIVYIKTEWTTITVTGPGEREEETRDEWTCDIRTPERSEIRVYREGTIKFISEYLMIRNEDEKSSRTRLVEAIRGTILRFDQRGQEPRHRELPVPDDLV